MNDVAVLIPTLRRPEPLAEAVRSLFDQGGVSGRLREIVVIDNDPEGSALAVVEALRAEAPVPLLYVHEPHLGVATARNAGLAVTEAPLIAFLDDDETAAPWWLATLIATLESCEADAVFGPIEAVLPEATPEHFPYLQRVFSRSGPDMSGPIAESYGCGGSLLRRATALAGAEPFDAGCDETGDEDSVLFARLKRAKGRLAWAADALAFEHIPMERAQLAYALKRAFTCGQALAQTCARAHDWLGVAKWMLVGAIQAVLYGVAALPAWALKLKDRAETLDRAARGLGKLLWIPRFETRPYAAMSRMGPAAN